MSDAMNVVPVSKRPYIVDEKLEKEIAEKGFAIVSMLDNVQVEQLRTLYNATHSVNQPGFFFSIFSNDETYRAKVCEQSLDVVHTSLQHFFKNYKVGYSGFVVRGPKDEGEFFIHQDPSFVDETQYAPLHIWCPLYDITMDYSPVCVIPKSHRLAGLHRAISVPARFEEVRDYVRPYLQPLILKAGQVIFLDPRLIHNSLPNKTDKARPVLLVQLFPEEAEYVTPFLNNGKIERYALPEDYFIRNTNFHANVDDKPALGTYIDAIPFEHVKLTEQDFDSFCREENLTPANCSTDKVIASESFVNPIS